jgi:hypothetical protein
MEEQHECDTWQTHSEVRFVLQPGDEGYVAGDVGAEHDSPYKVEVCEHGHKRTRPFTPEELQVSEVLDNVRTTESTGISRELLRRDRDDA